MTDAYFTPAPPVEHIDPFGGDSIQIEVTSKIDVAQLTEEIERKIKRDVTLSLSHGGSTPDDYSVPSILYVSPKDVDERTIRQAVLAHQPTERVSAQASGLPGANATSAAVTATKVALAPEGDYADALRRLAGGDDLSLEDVNDVLRAILGYAKIG